MTDESAAPATATPPASPVRKLDTSSLASHFGWSVVRQAVTVLSGVLLARGLGVEGRGLLAAALLWPVATTNIGLLGMSLHVQNLGRRQAHDLSNVAGSAFRIALWVGIVEMLLLLLFLPFLLPASAHSVVGWSRLFTLCIPISHLGLIATSLMLALGWINMQGAIIAGGSVLYALAIAVLAATGHVSPGTATLATLLGAPLSMAAVFFLYVRRFGFPSGPFFDWRMFLAALPFFAEQLSLAAVDQGGRLALLFVDSPEALGLFTVASSYAMLSTNMSKSIISVLFLKFSEKGSIVEQRDLIARAFRQGFLVKAPGPILLAAGSPIFVPLLFGNEFRPAAIAASVLLGAVLIQGQTKILHTAIRSEGRPMFAAVLQGSALIGLAATLVPAVKMFGVVGLSIAFLVGYIVEMALVIAFVVHRYGFKTSDLIVPRGDDFREAWKRGVGLLKRRKSKRAK